MRHYRRATRSCAPYAYYKDAPATHIPISSRTTALRERQRNSRVGLREAPRGHAWELHGRDRGFTLR